MAKKSESVTLFIAGGQDYAEAENDVVAFFKIGDNGRGATKVFRLESEDEDGIDHIINELEKARAKILERDD